VTVNHCGLSLELNVPVAGQSQQPSMTGDKDQRQHVLKMTGNSDLQRHRLLTATKAIYGQQPVTGTSSNFYRGPIQMKPPTTGTSNNFDSEWQHRSAK